MKTDNIAKARSDRVWLTADECHVEDFAALIERTTKERFAAVLGATVARLLSFLNNAATFAAMKSGDDSHPFTASSPAGLKAEYDAEIALLVTEFESHRKDLLARIAAYRSPR